MDGQESGQPHYRNLVQNVRLPTVSFDASLCGRGLSHTRVAIDVSLFTARAVYDWHS